MADEPEIISGLEGVYITDTTICKVDGFAGKLWYRGYPIEVLAEKSNFEEVSYLLLYGHLPTLEELDAFRAEMKNDYELQPELISMVKGMVGKSHPTDILRTAVSYLSAYDRALSDSSPAANAKRSTFLIAKMASIVAFIGRAVSGGEYVPPDPALSHAANMLFMMHGKKPDKRSEDILDLMLMLHAEHSTNASTFSTLVTASTLADMYAAITAGIATLKGPLHGGADEQALKMMYAIGKPENTETYIEDALAGKQKIMGFGHRVYKTYDPRAKIVKKYLLELEGDSQPEVKSLIDIALRAEKLMIDKLGTSKGIWPNIDFFSGPLYRSIDIKPEIFTSIFAASRVAGWCAHVLEYWQHNRLFRPLDYYIGQLDLEYVDIDKR